MENVIVTELRELFERKSADKGVSACPFLSKQQLKFLEEIRHRADANMYESPIEDFNDIRDLFIDAGYTDKINECFCTMMKTPETLQREKLIPILSLLYDSFSRLHEDRVGRYKVYEAEYEKLRTVTYIGEKGEGGVFIDRFRQSCQNISDFHDIVMDLNNVVARLKDIIHPPKPAELLQVNFSQ